MSVQLVPNKKTGAMYVPTSSGKWFRAQLEHVGMRERDGFFSEQKMTGFAYFATEALAKAFVATAEANDMQLEGQVIYIDQLDSIVEENPTYGMQFPYPFRFEGRELSWEERLMIQAKAAEAGLSLQQSGRPIYRRKMYTTDMTRKSVILTPDNMDDVNAFIATLLKEQAAPDPVKVARLAELRAIKASARTKDEKAEIVALMAEVE